MDIRELVGAILAGDLLTARQWVADARRNRLSWEDVGQPQGLSERELSVAAGLAELLAERSGSPPPSWTRAVGAVHGLLILDPGLETMPRTFAYAQASAPAPLRSRNLIAMPDFLDVA
jgi:hypothetical protein